MYVPSAKLQPPTFWQWTAPGCFIPYFTAPSFHGSPRTAPSNQNFTNKFLYTHIIVLSKILSCNTRTAPLWEDSMNGPPPPPPFFFFFLVSTMSDHECHSSKMVGPQLVPFSRLSSPPPYPWGGGGVEGKTEGLAC